MNRTNVVALALLAILSLRTSAARADLIFDLRAVSGSQIIIHSPKSVAVNQNSAGGWIDFELWGVVTGSNAATTDDGMQTFAGNMLSTHFGRGAAVGNMVNSSEIAPRVRRGIVAPFDGIGHQDGTVQNLDSDPEAEIGGTDHTAASGIIAGFSGFGAPVMNPVESEIASFLLYRFTLPVESMPAVVLSDMTKVHYVRSPVPINFTWYEDGVRHNVVGGGIVVVNDGVLIHTADTPEELAMIPEPGTWALALAGLLLTSWFALRRRN